MPTRGQIKIWRSLANTHRELADYLAGEGLVSWEHIGAAQYYEKKLANAANGAANSG